MLILSGADNEDAHHHPGHPERPARIAAAMAGIDDLHLGSDLRILPPTSADAEALARVHSAAYLSKAAAVCAAGGGNLDADTYVTTDSWHAARRAAGAGLAAIAELQQTGHHGDMAFVMARPPGHHALRDRAMGFCLINNIAVAAAALTAIGERVLIVDWDVHHGNGTQAIFWNDPHVLYVSTHQWPLYPGSGAADEVGGPEGRGQTINIPLPGGATGDIIRRALDEVALPTIETFAPTWVLVSAGFDAHRADPLANLALSAGDFAELATLVAGFVPQPGRMVLFLEGGYDLAALQASVTATIGALVGVPTVASSEDPTSGGPGAEMVQQAHAERRAALD